MDKIEVKIDTKLIGKVIKENNEFIFSYDSENTQDFISLIMPIRQKPYIHNKLHPIFEMHLPEGYLLSIIKKHFSKLTKTDDFGLLKIMSPSIKGRISYSLHNELEQENITLDDLLYSSNENLFDELVKKFALRSALSGVQPKVLATVTNKATLKCDDYIVKSWGEEYQELALNEYFCMKIVQNAGIEVPEFFISQDEKLFIMKRFDKMDDKYIGFEDMCVLMGKQRDDKYEGSYEQIAKIIKTFVSPKYTKSSLLQFFKMVYINFQIKNGDAHLKNFGLIYDGIDNIRLAPAYDVVSTTVYIQNDIPALLLLGSKKWWHKKFLIRFGIQTCDLSQKEIEEAIGVCEDAIDSVRKEIELRIDRETDSNKKEILEKLLSIYTKSDSVSSTE